jgi:hypothetical protein
MLYIQPGRFVVAKKYPGARKAPRRVSETKTPMSYRLSPGKIARAQAILGTATATATIEEALDLVIFRSELMDGVKQAFGLPVREAFPDTASGR